MKKIITLITVHIFLLAFISVDAQVSTNLNNNNKVSIKGKYSKVYKTEINFEVPKKSIKDLLERENAEVLSSNVDRPYRLATAVAVDIDIARQISWLFENEFAYGKYIIRLNGALSASINFDRFYLPPNSEMYIYNEDGSMITGPITENENNPNYLWGSWVYQGEYLNIEIRTPTTTYKELVLHSNNIAYGYKQIYKDRVGGFGNSESCNINVVCPLGTGWESERNSVALVLNDNGQEWCSGAMIMNTCNSSKPFFLTANHCFTGQNVNAWRFTFQAWSPTCPHPGVNSNGVTYNGSTLRANWAGSDFCLVELNNTPPSNSGINYLGWNRSSAAALNATGIHHPNGDVMKISRDAEPIIRSGGAYYNNATHWQVSWNQGITAGGSSGSPLFDQNRRVIGQLHGGTSYCSTPNAPDWYGSFDQSWIGGGTNATRLSNWLDPSNAGLMTTNTTNIANLAAPFTGIVINGQAVFCTSATYTTNLPVGTNVTWSVTQPGSTLSCTNCAQTTLTMSSAGNEWITASFGCPIQTVTLAVKSANYTSYSNFNTTGPQIFCKNQTATISVDQTAYPGLSNFIWGPIPAGWTRITGGTGSNYIVIKAPNSTSPPTFNLPVSATTICSTSSTVNHFLAMSNCTSFRISPNPSSDVIAIEEYDDNTGKLVAESNIKAVEIVNKMGLVNYRQQYKNKLIGKKLIIPVRTISNDVYAIRIYDGIEWKSYKVIVQHKF